MPEERFGARGVSRSPRRLFSRTSSISQEADLVGPAHQQQRSLFKVGSKSRRGGGMPGGGGGGGADFSMGLPQEGGEASYLYMPNIVRASLPFQNIACLRLRSSVPVS
jgi:hypothetical protein